MLVVYESRGFRKKTYNDFSNNTFKTEALMTNFVVCMEFNLFIKMYVLKYDQDVRKDLDYYFGFF